jgi:hypothetical protein
MPALFGRDFSRVDLQCHVGDTSQLFGVELLEYGNG